MAAAEGFRSPVSALQVTDLVGDVGNALAERLHLGGGLEAVRIFGHLLGGFDQIVLIIRVGRLLLGDDGVGLCHEAVPASEKASIMSG